jgi:hypothetical protein
MPFQPPHSAGKNTSDCADHDGAPDLHNEVFGVGGGDCYVAALFREARAQGFEVEGLSSLRLGDEVSLFRPDGYDSEDYIDLQGIQFRRNG